MLNTLDFAKVGGRQSKWTIGIVKEVPLNADLASFVANNEIAAGVYMVQMIVVHICQDSAQIYSPFG